MKDIKQKAIDLLSNSEKFILICGDGTQTHFLGEGLTLNEAIGMLEQCKYKFIADYGNVK